MSNDKTLNELVSVHLGKAGDGTVVKPYVTPDSIDPSLIVAVPRELNRTQYGIDKKTRMVGADVWHAYEVSTMLKSGYPFSGVLKWVYDAISCDNIIESKSAKLYLNSYNMHRWSNRKTLDGIHLPKSIVFSDLGYAVVDRFQEDFARIVEGKNEVMEASVHAVVHTGASTENPFNVGFTALEDLVDINRLQFTEFNEDPKILKITPGSKVIPMAVTTNALRSNCRVTNQPDWGDVFIYIEGEKWVTPESLLQYIVSMRKENHFHEEIAECIYKRLLDLLNPTEMVVACLYTRRGGIDICPVRATSADVMWKVASPLLTATTFTHKTARQ